jgi:hypothetical protein
MLLCREPRRRRHPIIGEASVDFWGELSRCGKVGQRAGAVTLAGFRNPPPE